MTRLYITIDTEYEFGFTARMGADSRAANFAQSISCETPSGPVGVGYQMDVFDRHGLKGVFFVDPMPALVWGVAAIEDVVGPIIARGHDVQCHLHTEWLNIAGAGHPLKNGKTGPNIKHFRQDEQAALILYARDVLMAAGAPKPTAFRAGNYGANDDTLRALAELGFAYDSSHAPAIPASDCAISLGAEDRAPMDFQGITEVPVGCIGDPRQGMRHAQLTALSCAEILAALRHAQAQNIPDFTLVSHSFELLSRDRSKANRVVKSRFEKLCQQVAAMEGMATGTYADHPPAIDLNAKKPRPILPANNVRTGLRMAEQALSNAFYGDR